MKRYSTEMKKKIVAANIQDGRTIASLASEYAISTASINIGFAITAKNAKCDYYQSKKLVKDRIKDIFHSTSGIVGHRGMIIFLARERIKLSKTTVHKYINQELQLYCITVKKRLRHVERTKHELFPNHLSQDFNIEKKNTVWCTDFTYIKGWDGKFQYNCSIQDILVRSIVANKTSRMMTSELAKETLETALSSQKKTDTGRQPIRIV